MRKCEMCIRDRAVAVYFKEIRRAEEKLSVKRDEIEAELPRFVATITQELAVSRDVLSLSLIHI